MILLIDNYDSFVHNLARYFRLEGRETQVVRNDAIDVAEVRELSPEAIVLSPGPGKPVDAGCSLEIVRQVAGEVPIFGVCLGHQVIVEALGGNIVRAQELLHGMTSSIEHTEAGLFEGLPNPLTVCRYHSLVAERESLPEELELTAWTEEGTPMAITHRELPLYGVQFHPEAILTEAGGTLIANFLRQLPLSTRTDGVK